MTADEMFEHLGYKKVEPDIIFYVWEVWEDNITEKRISFNHYYQTVDISDENGFGLTVKELQAINKKVKELGWLDE